MSTDLINTDQAAAMLGMMPRTLVIWRNHKLRGPAWIKMGRAVRYERQTILDYIGANRVDARSIG